MHIIGVDPSNPSGLAAYLGDKSPPASGTGTLDHIAFLATGVAQMWTTSAPRASPGATAPSRASASIRSSSRILRASRSSLTTHPPRWKAWTCRIRHKPQLESRHEIRTAKATQGDRRRRLARRTVCRQHASARRLEVEVFERTPEALTGRGAGIVTHPELFEALATAGVVVDDSIGVHVDTRITLARDGAVVSDRQMPQTPTAWGKMYDVLGKAFHRHLSHRCYRDCRRFSCRPCCRHAAGRL